MASITVNGSNSGQTISGDNNVITVAPGASDAFATFQKLERQRGAAGIARFQLALAKASVGDYEGAEAALADPESAGHLMGIVARVQVLSQLERNADAVKLLDDLDALESEPALKLLRDRLNRLDNSDG